MKFKALFAVLVIAAAGWFAWWWIAAGAQKAALEAWLADRRAAGWQAEAAAINVNGFPNRLDAILTEPALADPSSGWAWSAPNLSIFQFVYNPTEAIVAWPPEQRIAAPGARATVRSEVMRASFAFAAASDLTLQRNSYEVKNGAVSADAGWTAGVGYYNHHIRAAGPNAYDFKVDVTSLRLPDFLRRQIDPAGALPPAIEVISAEGRAQFTAPLDRYALEGPKPQVAALSLKQTQGTWGELALRISGDVEADAAGFAEGEFSLSAKNWEEMLDAAVAAGAMQKSLSDALKLGLGFVARLSGGRNTLDVSLTFENGFTRVGPVPVGPAPRMVR